MSSKKQCKKITNTLFLAEKKEIKNLKNDKKSGLVLAFLNTASECLIEAFKLNQSFKMEGKKEYLKQFILQWQFGMRLLLVVMVC